MSIRLRTSLVYIAISVLLIPALALEAHAGSLENIQTKIAQFLKRPGVRSAEWGIEILDPANNEILLSVNPEKTFKPASVLKVVTTAAALEKLGPDFQFHTTVHTNGYLTPDGELVGDLILVGRGDPNLVDTVGDLLDKSALQDLAEKLWALGVRKVTGNLIGDDSYFDVSMHGKGWQAHDLKTIYGAPISSLSINNNIFWVHARATRPNQLVSVSVEPRTSYFRIRNLGTTGAAKGQRTLSTRLLKGSRTIVVSGILPAGQGYSRHIVIQKPSEVTTSFFKDELKRHGIEVSGSVQLIRDGDIAPEARRKWTQLAGYNSPPLFRTLDIINKRSQNLHAEMLLRTLGAEFRNNGSDEAGLQVIRDFLVDAGIDSEKIRLNDGSGLSRDNLLTPRFQTSLLQFLSTRPYFGLFLNSLAISGTDGTLKNRLSNQTMRGAVYAKTGSLSGVSTLSGYLMTKSGRSLAFSIFANNVHASLTRVKKTIDEICTLFVDLD